MMSVILFGPAVQNGTPVCREGMQESCQSVWQ